MRFWIALGIVVVLSIGMNVWLIRRDAVREKAMTDLKDELVMVQEVQKENALVLEGLRSDLSKRDRVVIEYRDRLRDRVANGEIKGIDVIEDTMKEIDKWQDG